MVDFLITPKDVTSSRKSVSIICDFLGWERYNNLSESRRTPIGMFEYTELSYDFLIESFRHVMKAIPVTDLNYTRIKSLVQSVNNSLLTHNKYQMLVNIKELVVFLDKNDIKK